MWPLLCRYSAFQPFFLKWQAFFRWRLFERRLIVWRLIIWHLAAELAVCVTWWAAICHLICSAFLPSTYASPDPAQLLTMWCLTPSLQLTSLSVSIPNLPFCQRLVPWRCAALRCVLDYSHDGSTWCRQKTNVAKMQIKIKIQINQYQQRLSNINKDK